MTEPTSAAAETAFDRKAREVARRLNVGEALVRAVFDEYEAIGRADFIERAAQIERETGLMGAGHRPARLRIAGRGRRSAGDERVLPRPRRG